MLQEIEAAPRGFGFFVWLSIVLGAIGILGNTVLLVLSIAHGSASEVSLLAPAWLSALQITADSLQVYSGIQVRRHVDWARKALIALASISLVELLYNTGSLLQSQRLVLSPTTTSYFLIPLCIHSSIFYYFSRRAVKDFVRGAR